MKIDILSGATLAATAVALALGGTIVSPAAAEKSASVHCAGINSCKGKSACKSANNGCKGHKWLPAKSATACEAKRGTVG